MKALCYATIVLLVMTAGLASAEEFGLKANPATAQSSASANEPLLFTLQISSEAWSQYLGAVGAVFHDRPVLQNSIKLGLPGGFSVAYWQSHGLDDGEMSSNYGDEIDFTLGWSRSFADTTVSLAANYYTIYPLSGMAHGDIVCLEASVAQAINLHEEHTLTPSLKVDVAFPAKGDSPAKGTHVYADVAHAWKLRDFCTLNQSVGLMWDSGAYGLDERLVGRYSFSLDWKVTDWLSVSCPKIKAAAPLCPKQSDADDAGGRDGAVVLGAGVTLEF